MTPSRLSNSPGRAANCRRFRAVALLVGISLVAIHSAAFGGGGPENVFLLVNANSDSSKTIANHYIALRKIPARNVMYIDWKGSVEFGNGKVLREKLLLPILQEMHSRGIGPQIDYLIYSSDFPWRFELNDLFPDATFQQPFTPTSSLTGSTFYAPLLAGTPPVPVFVFPNMNWY